jgi:16S rRNA (adenine1518-N6/adenine1519-N6)-dimethyltransferase
MTIHSPLASPRATKAVLEQFGLVTKKSLGQHFLVDDGVVGRILALAEVGEADTILEVGPGIGTLTLALLQQAAAVIAIEKDASLLAALAHTTKPYATHFTLIQGDALSPLCLPFLPPLPANLSPLSSQEPSPCSPGLPTKLVANLPYAVAATIVLDYFQKLPSLQSATVMVQQEVAQRMMAQPGSKAYGAYTVKLQLFALPVGSFAVAPSNFMPPPRVDSTVIRLNRCRRQSSPQLLNAASFLAEAAFAQRRKNIRNSMRAHFALNGVDPDVVDQLLQSARVSPKLRGETLAVEQYRELGQLYLEDQGLTHQVPPSSLF